MRSREKNLFAIVFFIIVLSIPLLNYAKPDSIEVSIRAGYNDLIRVNSTCPFYIELKNNGNNVDGEIQIFVVNGHNTKMMYAIPFDLPSNSKKEFVMNIPIMTASKTYDVRIVSSNRDIIDTKYMFNKLLSPETPVVGIMTDDVNKLRTIRDVKFQESVVSHDESFIVGSYPKPMIPPVIAHEKREVSDLNLEIIEIDKDTLSDKAEVLSTFDYIIISDYNTSSLSDDQNKALEQWVSSGKTLIIGTGPNSRKVYSGLKETLKPFDILSQKKITFDQYFEVFPSSDSDQFESVVSTGSIGDGVVFMGDKENPLAINYSVGDGKITVLTFDPTLDPFTNLNISKNMWELVLSYGFNIQYTYEDDYYNQRYYSRYDNFISQVPEEHTPPLYFLLGIMSLYIIIVGPLLYIFLKYKDKRDYSWLIIPLVSFLFIGLVYVAGFKTRYTTAVLNSYSLINMDSDAGKLIVDSSMGLFNNNKGTMKIEYYPEQNLEVSSTDRYYHMNYNYNNEDFENAILTNKILFSNPMVHEIYNIPMWEPAYLKTSLSTEFQGDIFSYVSLSEDEKLVAKIKNHTQFNFQDSFIVVGNKFIYVGDINSGDEEEIEVKLNDSSIKDSYNSFISDLYPNGNYYYSRGQSIDLDHIRKRSAIDNLYERLSTMLISQSMFSKIKIAFVALNFDQIDHGIIVNKKYPKTYNTNAIYTVKEIKFEKGEKTAIPQGVIKAVLDGNRNEGNVQRGLSGAYIFPNSTEAYFTFDIPRELLVKQFELSFSMNYRDDYYSFNNSIPDEVRENYKLYISNIETGEWEHVTDFILIRNDIEKYINSSNQIEIKADVKLNEYQYGYEYLWTPEISVSGVVR